MLPQITTGQPSAKFTVEGLAIKGFEERFLCGNQRALELKEFGLEEDGVNATGLQSHGVCSGFESAALVAVFFRQEAGLQSPCLAALAVKG